MSFEMRERKQEIGSLPEQELRPTMEPRKWRRSAPPTLRNGGGAWRGRSGDGGGGGAPATTVALERIRGRRSSTRVLVAIERVSEDRGGG